MKDIHEYNYQAKGFKKFVIDYKIEGYNNEKTLKAFSKTENGAKRQIKSLYPGMKLQFTHVYEC